MLQTSTRQTTKRISGLPLWADSLIESSCVSVPVLSLKALKNALSNGFPSLCIPQLGDSQDLDFWFTLHDDSPVGAIYEDLLPEGLRELFGLTFPQSTQRLIELVEIFNDGVPPTLNASINLLNSLNSTGRHNGRIVALEAFIRELVDRCIDIAFESGLGTKVDYTPAFTSFSETLLKQYPEARIPALFLPFAFRLAKFRVRCFTGECYLPAAEDGSFNAPLIPSVERPYLKLLGDFKECAHRHDFLQYISGVDGLCLFEAKLDGYMPKAPRAGALMRLCLFNSWDVRPPFLF